MPAGAPGAERRVGQAQDGGSASIWILAAMSLVLLAGFVASSVGAACVARHRAESAADLAALAGAARAATGKPDACARAAAVAVANGGQLVACDVLGADVLVTVSVTPPGLPARFGRARGRARAGPVDMAGSGRVGLPGSGSCRRVPGGRVLLRR